MDVVKSGLVWSCNTGAGRVARTGSGRRKPPECRTFRCTVSIRTESGWRSCSWRVSSSPGPRCSRWPAVRPGVGNRTSAVATVVDRWTDHPSRPPHRGQSRRPGRRSRSSPQHWTASTHCPHLPDQPKSLDRDEEGRFHTRGRGPRRHPTASGDRPWPHTESAVATPNPKTLRRGGRGPHERLRLVVRTGGEISVDILHDPICRAIVVTVDSGRVPAVNSIVPIFLSVPIAVCAFQHWRGPRGGARQLRRWCARHRGVWDGTSSYSTPSPASRYR